MTPDIDFYIDLPVNFGGFVEVPNCHPATSVSSYRLALEIKKNDCQFLVKLEDALEIIPGSTIVFGHNYGNGGIRKRWFRLPSRNSDCPCTPYPDYFSMLKTAEFQEPEPEICPTTCVDWDCFMEDDQESQEPSNQNVFGISGISHPSLPNPDIGNYNRHLP